MTLPVDHPMVCALLDIEIRARTAGARSLDDVLRVVRPMLTETVAAHPRHTN